MTLLALVSGVVGALLFGTMGGLGRVVAGLWYGSIEPAADGPAAGTVPAWTFVALPACVGAIVGDRGVPLPHLVMLLPAMLALSVCAATDLRAGMLPDLFTLGPLVVLLAFAAFERVWSPLAGAAFVAAPLAIIATMTRGRGMGWGDVKLAAFGGALVGIGGVTLAVALAAIAAASVAAVTGRLRRPIAFGPYLAASIAVVLGFGDAS
jgi:prepilin signal peptidase PulO-like enzyme (type II secretory pathway)